MSKKHLTLENRIYIENELNKGTSLKGIAKFLCKGACHYLKRGKGPSAVQLVQQGHLL